MKALVLKDQYKIHNFNGLGRLSELVIVSENIRIKEIKPVLAKYISDSQVLLKRSVVPDEMAIHDIRVLMKKSRAVLRLIGPLINSGLNDKDFQSLKRVGMIMSDWRDTSVHRKILKELKKDYPFIFSHLQGNVKISNLMTKPDHITEPGMEMKKGIDEIDDLLRKTQYRIRFQQIQKIDPVKLIERLELSHDVGRKIYLECINNPKPEKIHELRKRSKDFLYQLYFFRPIKPASVKSLEKKVERMTIFLGKYNDHFQLLKTIGYVYPDEANTPALDELVIKIREKQNRYLSRVWPSAYKCFCPGLRLVDILGFKNIKPDNPIF